MGTSIKIVNLNGASEALPAKNIRCPHQNINPKQLCYVCKGENDVVDFLASIHLEVDVEAMASELDRMPNYEDAIPSEMWIKIQKAVKENDQDFFMFLMQANTRLVRKECIKAVSTTILKWARLVRK